MLKKSVILLVIFTVLFAANVTSAQEKACTIDVSEAASALESVPALVDAGNTDLALDVIGRAQQALALIEANCSEYAPETAGDSRTNPVPLGQSQHAVISNDFEGSIQVLEYLDDGEEFVLAANRRNDPAPEGTRYVVYRLKYTCERPASESCKFSRVYFSIVGDKGVSYRYNSAADYEILIRDIGEEQEIFGGSEIETAVAFVVPEDDANFILFTEYGDPRVFFAGK